MEGFFQRLLRLSGIAVYEFSTQKGFKTSSYIKREVHHAKILLNQSSRKENISRTYTKTYFPPKNYVLLSLLAVRGDFFSVRPLLLSPLKYELTSLLSYFLIFFILSLLIPMWANFRKVFVSLLLFLASFPRPSCLLMRCVKLRRTRCWFVSPPACSKWKLAQSEWVSEWWVQRVPLLPRSSVPPIFAWAK